MFHEVRIFNPNGDLKQVVPSKDLSRSYWKNFEIAEDQISLTNTGRAKVPRWIKDHLDVEFHESYDSNII